MNVGLKDKPSESDQVQVVFLIEVQQFNMNHEWPECAALIHFKRASSGIAVKMHIIN